MKYVQCSKQNQQFGIANLLLKDFTLKKFCDPYEQKCIPIQKEKKRKPFCHSFNQLTSPEGQWHCTTGWQNTRKNKLRCGNPFPVHVFLVSITCKLSKEGFFCLLSFLFFLFSFPGTQNIEFHFLSGSYLVLQPKKHMY